MKILAVEDDPVSGWLLATSLCSLGCEVALVGDGETAWERLAHEEFRLVVCDWMLPGFDGLELCRRIRAREGDYVYFILITNAPASEANESAAMEAGIDEFMTKPVTPYELRNRLRVAERILKYTTQVRQLESFLPICGYCKKVRDDRDYWQQIENYIGERTGTSFSHSICPDCFQRHVEPHLHVPPVARAVAPVAEVSLILGEPPAGERKVG